jgi:hypothetical protein
MSPGFDALSYGALRGSAVSPPSCANDPGAAPCGGWRSYLGLPFEAVLLNATTDRDARVPNVPPPKPGSIWRCDFSRVEWRVLTQSGQYVKDPAYPNEDNWVWAPTGVVNIHEPERWGILSFAGPDGAGGEDELSDYLALFGLRDRAMQIYYAQHAYASDNNGTFAGDAALLAPYYPAGEDAIGGCGEAVAIELGEGGAAFVATVELEGLGSAAVDQERFLTARGEGGERAVAYR